jgi:hypothetical protein
VKGEILTTEARVMKERARPKIERASLARCHPPSRPGPLTPAAPVHTLCRHPFTPYQLSSLMKSIDFHLYNYYIRNVVLSYYRIRTQAEEI